MCCSRQILAICSVYLCKHLKWFDLVVVVVSSSSTSSSASSLSACVCARKGRCKGLSNNNFACGLYGRSDSSFLPITTKNKETGRCTKWNFQPPSLHTNIWVAMFHIVQLTKGDRRSRAKKKVKKHKEEHTTHTTHTEIWTRAICHQPASSYTRTARVHSHGY